MKGTQWFLKQKAGSGIEPTRPRAKAPKALAKKDVARDLAEPLLEGRRVVATGKKVSLGPRSQP